MTFLVKISRLASRYFVGLVLAFSLAGFFNPEWFSWVKPLIKPLLGVIMFGMGMTLTPQNLSELAKRPWEAFAGAAAQYTVMPLLAWGIAVMLDLPPDLAVGMVLLGSCPGGTASNVITFLAGGDVALSVAMTSLSTILSPILTPLLTLWLAGHWIPIPASALFLSIIQIVIIPVILGYLFHRFFPNIVRKGIPVLPLVSVTAIVLIVAFVIGSNADQLQKAALMIFLAVVLHNGAGLALGYLIGSLLKMTVKKRRTVAVEVGMQNSGLAVALAETHFAATAASLPGAIFSVWHNITGPLLATIWNRRQMKIKEKEREKIASPR